MSWRVQYTRTFLKEMSRLPSNIRERVEAIAFGKGIKQDPFMAGKTQKLSGYRSFYKIASVITEQVFTFYGYVSYVKAP
jgi:mRNA interferase RelE/StbE